MTECEQIRDMLEAHLDGLTGHEEAEDGGDATADLSVELFRVLRDVAKFVGRCAEARWYGDGGEKSAMAAGQAAGQIEDEAT